MYIPKRYGESKIEDCPFCGKQATIKNMQGLNVCQLHKDQMLPDIKCVCGSYLELKIGRFGPYFNCLNCGNINLGKALEMLEHMQEKQNVKLIKETKDPSIADAGKYPGFDYGIE